MSRRRWLYAAVGSCALVTAVVVTLVFVLPSGGGSARLAADATPTPTQTASPAATYSAVPTSPPTTGPTPATRNAEERTPTPRAAETKATPSRECREVTAANCPDGRPGWDDGSKACFIWTAKQDGPPREALTINLDLESTTVTSHAYANGVVTVTNTGLKPIRYFDRTSAHKAYLTDNQGRVASATSFTDWDWVDDDNREVVLGPGDTDQFDVSVTARTCGDTSHDEYPALSPGSYQAVAALPWSTGDANDASDYRYGTWLTPPVAVTVTG